MYTGKAEADCTDSCQDVLLTIKARASEWCPDDLFTMVSGLAFSPTAVAERIPVSIQSSTLILILRLSSV